MKTVTKKNKSENLCRKNTGKYALIFVEEKYMKSGYSIYPLNICISGHGPGQPAPGGHA